VHFSTNDNHLSVIDLDGNLGRSGEGIHTNDTFCWDKRIRFKDENFNSELKEIIIKDLSDKTHSIYRNDKYFK